MESSDSEALRPLGRSVVADEAGSRIDWYLATNFPFLSRNNWQKKIRTGGLLVGGRRVSPSYKLRLGDSFAMIYPQSVEPDVSRDLRLVWQEGGVIAVYKPAPLPMHEVGPYRHNTFAALLQEKFGDNWAAVHRLDIETSGIVLCAESYELRSKLAVALADRKVFKQYTALTFGTASERFWSESGPIGDLESSRIRIKKWVTPNGQPAQTDFELIREKAGFSWLRARPKTGRTNQIRIHAAFRGLHLLGDKLYHPNEEVFLTSFETGDTEWVQSQIIAPRLCLHADTLGFAHPETKQFCEVHCEVPKEVTDVWDELPKRKP